MPFVKPTLTELVSRAKADINARLPGANAALRHTVLNVLAYCQAAMAYGAYCYLDYISKQVLPDTADSEYLERHASLWGLSRKAAIPAEGVAVFTGADGTRVERGLQVKRQDGVLYAVTAEGTVKSGQVKCPVVSLTAGVTGDLDAGESLTLVEAVVGLETTVKVDTGGIVGGAETETDDELRRRLLERLREPPRGGTKADYVAWAKETPDVDVTRAWCYPTELGIGTVTVRFACDNADVIPTTQDVKKVQAYIDSVRPVTAHVTVVAPTKKVVNFTIKDLYPDTAENRAQIKAALHEVFVREAVPGVRVYLSHIRAAISGVTGETDHTLIAPTADIVSAKGELLVMGDVTWQ